MKAGENRSLLSSTLPTTTTNPPLSSYSRPTLTSSALFRFLVRPSCLKSAGSSSSSAMVLAERSYRALLCSSTLLTSFPDLLVDSVLEGHIPRGTPASTPARDPVDEADLRATLGRSTYQRCSRTTSPMLRLMANTSSWPCGIPLARKITTDFDLSRTPILTSSLFVLPSIVLIRSTTCRKRCRDFLLIHVCLELTSCASCFPVDLRSNALLSRASHHSRRVQEGFET